MHTDEVSNPNPHSQNYGSKHAGPFQRPDYVQSYAGLIVNRTGSPCPVFVRQIEGQPYRDGNLPWPYVWLDDEGGAILRDLYGDLISLSGVLVPSRYHPRPDSADIVPFKEHFMFDPNSAPLKLSRKSRSNLTSGQKIWQLADAISVDDWLSFEVLYQELVLRRGLMGGRFDFGADHFARLARLPYMRIFGVQDGSSWGAMACGACYRDEIHLLHIVVSAEGLMSNASYVLMHEITSYCQMHGITLFMGGVPGGDNVGALRFKKRWSNQTRTSWLLRMIIQPDIYGKLAIQGNSFFPAYRQSW